MATCLAIVLVKNEGTSNNHLAPGSRSHAREHVAAWGRRSALGFWLREDFGDHAGGFVFDQREVASSGAELHLLVIQPEQVQHGGEVIVMGDDAFDRTV